MKEEMASAGDFEDERTLQTLSAQLSWSSIFRIPQMSLLHQGWAERAK
ncbi:MAG: hypothetical protein QG575_932, partial [Euryarchaeota archaeon]|nr:hypothetical protein [Euryarchaeota archaeon]